jgi:hypothetical protein
MSNARNYLGKRGEPLVAGVRQPSTPCPTALYLVHRRSLNRPVDLGVHIFERLGRLKVTIVTHVEPEAQEPWDGFIDIF